MPSNQSLKLFWDESSRSRQHLHEFSWLNHPTQDFRKLRSLIFHKYSIYLSKSTIFDLQNVQITDTKCSNLAREMFKFVLQK